MALIPFRSKCATRPETQKSHKFRYFSKVGVVKLPHLLIYFHLECHFNYDTRYLLLDIPSRRIGFAPRPLLPPHSSIIFPAVLQCLS